MKRGHRNEHQPGKAPRHVMAGITMGKAEVSKPAMLFKQAPPKSFTATQRRQQLIAKSKPMVDDADEDGM